ncbi:MAG: hypothetical protein P1U54_06470 [Immundisolibacteraceae bacterium]|nr:hypothetical protein [Immundisolibacteraceae bacterium]
MDPVYIVVVPNTTGTQSSGVGINNATPDNTKHVELPPDTTGNNSSGAAGETSGPAEIDPQPAEHTDTPADDSSNHDDEVSTPAEGQSDPTDYVSNIDHYSVVLAADKTIRMPGLPGELRVWIGSPQYKTNLPDRMVHDKAMIPAVGESAIVEPFAPAFKIDPMATQCIKIHPSGSEMRFKLIPQKHGAFEVGANVFLFDSPNCSGAPIPKAASSLKVLVEVDQKEIFSGKANELWTILWEKLLDFWAALVAAFFGLVLFLIRGKLKNWFGYQED